MCDITAQYTENAITAEFYTVPIPRLFLGSLLRIRYTEDTAVFSIYRSFKGYRSAQNHTEIRYFETFLLKFYK